MGNDKLDYGAPASNAVVDLERQKMSLESGLLGRVFGGRTTAPTNIAGLVIAVMLVLAAVSVFRSDVAERDKILQTVATVLGLALGFVFGRGLKDA